MPEGHFPGEFEAVREWFVAALGGTGQSRGAIVATWLAAEGRPTYSVEVNHDGFRLSEGRGPIEDREEWRRRTAFDRRTARDALQITESDSNDSASPARIRVVRSAAGGPLTGADLEAAIRLMADDRLAAARVPDKVGRGSDAEAIIRALGYRSLRNRGIGKLAAARLLISWQGVAPEPDPKDLYRGAERTLASLGMD